MQENSRGNLISKTSVKYNINHVKKMLHHGSATLVMYYVIHKLYTYKYYTIYFSH